MPAKSGDVIGLMDELNKAMTEFRKQDARVRDLKAAIATHNVRVGMQDSKLASSELSKLLQNYLTAW